VSIERGRYANPQYEIFYPFTWLNLLPNFDLGFRLCVVVHYYIAALAMYAFLRSCSLRPSSSALGAISWGVGGPLLSLSNLITILFSAAWIPALALSVRRFYRLRRPRDFAAAALRPRIDSAVRRAIGHLHAGILMAIYGLARVIAGRDRIRETRRAVVITAALALTATLIACPGVRSSARYTARRCHDPQGNHGLEYGSRSATGAPFANIFGRFTAGAPFDWSRVIGVKPSRPGN
jgi:hypothetical protein